MHCVLQIVAASEVADVACVRASVPRMDYMHERCLLAFCFCTVAVIPTLVSLIVDAAICLALCAFRWPVFSACVKPAVK